jgi:ribosomal protein S14
MNRCASCGGRPYRFRLGANTCRDCLRAWPTKLPDAREEWERIEKS